MPQQTTKRTSHGMMMTTRKKTQKPRHHRRPLTRLLPAPPLSHSPRLATRLKSSPPDEARRTSLRVWRTPTLVTILCLALQAVHQAVRRRRKRTPPRTIAMMIGSRSRCRHYPPCVCQLLAIMMENSNFWFTSSTHVYVFVSCHCECDCSPLGKMCFLFTSEKSREPSSLSFSSSHYSGHSSWS